MTIVSSLSLLVQLGSLPALKAVSLFTHLCSSNTTDPGAGAAFFSVDGVPMGTLVKSLVTHFFVFNFHCHGVVSVCLLFVECVRLPPFCSLRSPLLACCGVFFFGSICWCEVFSCTCLPSRCSSRSPLFIPFVDFPIAKSLF